jgi:sporulation protein YlmC with PRC-barrel domain
MDANKLKGMAVVSIAEGAKLGYVDDLLFDTQTLRPVALRVAAGGQHFVIPFEQLKNIGADAITVESSQVTQVAGKEGTFSNLLGLSKIKGLKVIDTAGTFLGTIASVEIDLADGHVLSLTAHKGGVLGLGGTSTTIDTAAIRSVGAEIVTVATQEPPPAEQPPPPEQ